MDFDCPWCGEELLDLGPEDMMMGVDAAPIIRQYDTLLGEHVQECQVAQEEMGNDNA